MIVCFQFVILSNQTSDKVLYSAASATFGITLDEVNWLGNIIALTYLVAAPLVPIVCSKYGLRVSVSVDELYTFCSC